MLKWSSWTRKDTTTSSIQEPHRQPTTEQPPTLLKHRQLTPQSSPLPQLAPSRSTQARSKRSNLSLSTSPQGSHSAQRPLMAKRRCATSWPLKTKMVACAVEYRLAWPSIGSICIMSWLQQAGMLLRIALCRREAISLWINSTVWQLIALRAIRVRAAQTMYLLSMHHRARFDRRIRLKTVRAPQSR